MLQLPLPVADQVGRVDLLRARKERQAGVASRRWLFRPDRCSIQRAGNGHNVHSMHAVITESKNVPFLHVSRCGRSGLSCNNPTSEPERANPARQHEAYGRENKKATRRWLFCVHGLPDDVLLSRAKCSLSSAQRRFTVLFGMGRGGSTALWSSSITCRLSAPVTRREQTNSARRIATVFPIERAWRSTPREGARDAVDAENRIGCEASTTLTISASYRLRQTGKAIAKL